MDTLIKKELEKDEGMAQAPDQLKERVMNSLHGVDTLLALVNFAGNIPAEVVRALKPIKDPR